MNNMLNTFIKSHKGNALYIMATATALGLMSIAILAIYAKLNRYQGRGFERRFIESFQITSVDTVMLEDASQFYMAGRAKNTVYISSRKTPARLVEFHLTTNDTTHRLLSIEHPVPLLINSIQVNVDSPNFYLSEGTVPVIYKGDLQEKVGRRIEHSLPYFTDFIFLSGNKGIIRSLSAKKNNILGIIDLKTGSVCFDHNILVPQIDGIFCTAGLAQKTYPNGTAVYVYTYRNEFFVLDSGLSVTTRMNTIDTTTTAKIKVATLRKGSSSNLSSPPTIVNRKVSALKNLVFIQSQMFSDNETIGEKEYTPVDIYDLNDRTYMGSFRLPLYKKERLSEFMVLDQHRILLIYPSGILSLWVRF